MTSDRDETRDAARDAMALLTTAIADLESPVLTAEILRVLNLRDDEEFLAWVVRVSSVVRSLLAFCAGTISEAARRRGITEEAVLQDTLLKLERLWLA